MADSFFAFLHQTFPFNGMKMRPDGLELSHCNCSGSQRMFIPREHIDFIHCGRKFHFGGAFLGAALVVLYFLLKEYTSANMPWLWYVGAAVAGLALLASIPRSLWISSNNANFISTNCCNSMDDLLIWLHRERNEDRRVAGKRGSVNGNDDANFMPPTLSHAASTPTMMMSPISPSSIEMQSPSASSIVVPMQTDAMPPPVNYSAMQ